jgi:hypothetical protein
MANNESQPSFQILICLIKIWTPKSINDPMTVPSDAMLISEVEEIEIEESYKKLIGTASVRFPRGTVIRKTIDKFNEEEAASNKILQANITDAGVLEEVRQETSVASSSSFSIGQRIRIYLGYTQDPNIANLAKTSNTGKSIYNDSGTLNKYENSTYIAEKAMSVMFDGYITKISVDTPIELHCENLASALKNITCPKVTIKSKSTVNDFLSDSGRYKLLKGTGISLHPDTESQQYDLGAVTLTPDLTVADVLTEWAKYGLHSFVTEYNGKPVIAVGRSYFSNAKKDSIINAITQPAQPVKILFDYHVASNDLSLTNTDKKYLAIEAEGLSSDDKFIHLTLLRNPKYDESSGTGDPWRVVNETQLSKKAMKLGARPLSKSSDRISMKLYNKVPYHSRKIPITKDELLEEAIKYFESYNMNGIEGTLTLFGDLHLKTGTKVELVDNRYPGKNGYYLVEEVHTTFGSHGYRQRIKLPYCIKRIKQENNGE